MCLDMHCSGCVVQYILQCNAGLCNIIFCFHWGIENSCVSLYLSVRERSMWIITSRLLGIKEVQIYGKNVGYLWEVLPKYQDVPDICICEQRPPITPTWTLSSTRETITSARKPTTWDESIHRVWRQRRRWAGAKGEIWKSVMAHQQLEDTRDIGDDEDINNVAAVNPRWTGVNTLLSTRLRLTHTMTVTERRTTWATPTAQAVTFFHSLPLCLPPTSYTSALM